jgi:hypothetical protein
VLGEGRTLWRDDHVASSHATSGFSAVYRRPKQRVGLDMDMDMDMDIRVGRLSALSPGATADRHWEPERRFKSAAPAKASERPMQDDLVSSAPQPTTAGKSA